MSEVGAGADVPLNRTDLVRRLFAKRVSTLTAAARRVRGAEDAAAIHDLRVAVRRMDAMLRTWDGLFPSRARDAAIRTLRRVRRRLGRARELQVHVGLLEPRAPAHGEPATRLLERVKRRLARRVTRAARRMRPKRVARLLGRIDDAASEMEPRLDGAPQLFERAAWRARQFGGAAHTAVARAREQRDDWTLHEARIAIKKWRYTLECIDEIAIGVQAASIAMLREIQEALGTIHDRAALVEAIERFTRDADRPALRPMIEELEAEKRAAMQEFLVLAEALGERRARARAERAAAAAAPVASEATAEAEEPAAAHREAQQRWEQMARWLVKEKRSS